MKVGTIAYLPPDGFLGAKEFMRNITAYKTKHDLFFYEDSNRHSWATQIPNPERSKIGSCPAFTVNNCVFLHGMALALAQGLDYFLYLESDCRVQGDNWDERLFDEALAGSNGMVLSGSPVIQNLVYSGMPAMVAATEFMVDYWQRYGEPVSVYGGPRNPTVVPTICFFTNGAGSIYHTRTIASAFPGLRFSIPATARQFQAWDTEIGFSLWEKFGVSMFSKFKALRSAFSGYGDILYSEDERREMLTSGKRCLVHQIKSTWLP